MRFSSRIIRIIASLAVLATSLSATSVSFADPTTQPVRDDLSFTLRSPEGREWSLKDFEENELVDVAFLGTECPLAKLYGKRLAKLHAEYAEKGVAFVGIDSNRQDSMTEIAAYVRRHEIPFTVLRDDDHVVADTFHAARTPQVFLLDKDRKVRYEGRVDDQYGVGVSRDKPTRNELREAIDSLLAGEKIAIAKTEPAGCIIGRAKKTPPRGDVTYTSHIADIFNRRCLECHRDGEIAPFPLASYDDALGWEDMIVEVIQEKRMPPWFANPEHGSFANDARLTDKEKSLIIQWVENGAPEGDPGKLPATPDFPEGWRIPEPDQIIKMRETPFNVPATGVVDYKRFVADPGWDEDKYIYATEARPDNTSVVHHILVYVLAPGSRRRTDLGRVLVGYAPGSTPTHLKDGVAIKVPAGSKLLFEMHYTPNGYPAKDCSYAGVCFMDKKDVTTELQGRIAIKPDFRIPPRAENHVVKANFTFDRDEMLISMTPHMHLRGKSFKYEATYPDGEKEVLLDVPRYDFNWQLKYILAEPKLIPAGTRLLCTAVYDNSSKNLANPNPDKSIRWGDQSWEEMMIGFFNTIKVDKSENPPRSENVKIDPSGTWVWEQQFAGRRIKHELNLKLEGDTLKAELKADGKSTTVRRARVVEDEISFQVDSKELPNVLIGFRGTVSKDRLRGKLRLSFGAVGKSMELPWNAERKE